MKNGISYCSKMKTSSMLATVAYANPTHMLDWIQVDRQS